MRAGTPFPSRPGRDDRTRPTSVLAVDLGGTKTLVGLFDADGRLRGSRRFASAQFDGLLPLLERFLAEECALVDTAGFPGVACVAVAGPVDSGHARVTHLPWEIDACVLGVRLGLARVLLVNDFVAAAAGITALRPEEVRSIQSGRPVNGAPRLVIGAGTGLGCALLLDAERPSVENVDGWLRDSSELRQGGASPGPPPEGVNEAWDGPALPSEGPQGGASPGPPPEGVKEAWDGPALPSDRNSDVDPDPGSVARPRVRILAGEGGHIGFAPRTPLEGRLWQWLQARQDYVNVEAVVSGPGIIRIHAFLRQEHGLAPQAWRPDGTDPAEAISSAALDADNPDVLAVEALDLFAAAFGAVAGDLALASLARGGVYLAGGIAPKVFDERRTAAFLRAFNAKGGHARLMSQIPVGLVQVDDLGLRGAAVLARGTAFVS